MFIGTLLILLVCIGGSVFGLRQHRLLTLRLRPLKSLDLNDPAVVSIAMELQQLHRMPIVTKTDREVWYLAAKVLERKLSREYASVFGSLPHELMHYLSDADIRAKDPGYARYQEKQIEAILALDTRVAGGDS